MSEPRITRRKITEYAPDAQNANRGTERGHRLLDDSVTELGLGRSVLADKHGTLIGGNKTQQAAVDNGFEDAIEIETDGKTLVVVKRTDLDLNDLDPNNPARRMAYFDNRVSQLNLDFDPARLLSDMQTGVDLSKLWSADELAALLAGQLDEDATPDAGAQVDRAGELQAIWQVARGDVWQCGKHRIMCGDSTIAADVAKLMDGAKVQLMVTDPPYGIDHDTSWREVAGISSMGAQSAKGIEWDSNDDWASTYELSGAQVAFVWHASSHNIIVAQSLVKAGYEVKQMIIWNKTVAPFGRSHYSYKHEPCWYAVKKGMTANWQGSNNEVTVWEAASPRHIMGGSDEEKQPHPTQKPLECMLRPITNHTAKNEMVYDPFLGSGTTIVACHNTGRVGAGMEISPEYTSVCLQRLADMNLKPERVS